MGCAGSKPHMLLSSSMNNHNSPQKGFILFNAKTIEYLIANEAEVKQKLVQRCQPKLLKTMPQSLSKSSLLGAKRSLLNTNTSSSLDNAETDKTTKVGKGVKSNKSDATLNGSTTTEASKSGLGNGTKKKFQKYQHNCI